MAYDPELAQSIRNAIVTITAFKEKKMFGGICFLINGNMACGILNRDLIVRVGPERYEECLKSPNARKFDITGRPMKGWVMVSFGSSVNDLDLNEWIQTGVSFARSLPPKSS